MTTVPVTVPARDEAGSIGACLDALLASIAHATRATGVRLEPVVVLDDCTDRTGDEARRRGVPTIASTGGKLAAQRAGVRPGPFQIFLDADVVVTEPTLAALVTTMAARPGVFVATPPRRPVPPLRVTPLARALHLYNLERGFSSHRSWFNGKCFAIRRFDVPTREELAPRIAALPPDRFHDHAAGLRADDVYLSRRIVADLGPSAIAETDEGCVLYRAPETWRGGYLYYRRMRMEMDRVSALFPELEPARARHGARRADRLAGAPAEHRRALRLLRALFASYALAYRAERVAWQRLARGTCPGWPVVEETKWSADSTTRG